jgi:D-alanyl-D-alanine carboxypeptidase/D-alanyl-D-alanine-endopeptidase (penicillin-binding protein 4)
MPSRLRRCCAGLVAALLVATGTGATASPASDLADVQAAQAAARPRPALAVPLPVSPAADGTPVSADALAAVLTDELGDAWLGERVALTVRDAATGEHLLDRDADVAVTPASLTKLLSAAAVVSTLPVDERFRTSVVAGSEAGELVLVAGGDMLLAAGEGDPESVAGRAGLADLARQVAEALAAEPPAAAPDDAATTSAPTGPPPVRLALDTGYAAGPDRPPGWTDYWMQQGYTGPVTMLGLVRDRATVFHPAPADPAQQAARAFHQALEDAGVDVAGEPGDPVPAAVAPEGARTLGVVESAPVGEVLGLALTESDNALTEQLVRQAAVRAGVATDQEAVNAWVVQQVGGYGIDTAGVRLADVSGLSDGTTVPARVVADVLAAAVDGDHPELQSVVARLPVAGYNGTLWDRFHLPVHAPAVGVARAKTGSLPGVTSLAGTVVTADGRLLVYAMVADRIGRDGAALEARSVLDEIVAELARCGC